MRSSTYKEKDLDCVVVGSEFRNVGYEEWEHSCGKDELFRDSSLYIEKQTAAELYLWIHSEQ